MNDDPVLLDVRHEIAPDALLVDRIEAVITRDLVASAGRGREELVEQADEIGRLEIAHRHVDRLER